MSKNITPRNDKNQKHGYCEVYWGNGNLAFKSFFHNNRRVGYGEWYGWYSSKLTEKKYYI